jgi:hypothetical protein
MRKAKPNTLEIALTPPVAPDDAKPGANGSPER